MNIGISFVKMELGIQYARKKWGQSFKREHDEAVIVHLLTPQSVQSNILNLVIFLGGWVSGIYRTVSNYLLPFFGIGYWILAMAFRKFNFTAIDLALELWIFPFGHRHVSFLSIILFWVLFGCLLWVVMDTKLN